jgi:hypothetical protein
MPARCMCPPWNRRAEKRLTGGGNVVAIVCATCTRTISEACRVCRGLFASLAIHHGKADCGRFDRAGMWWTPDRPPNAGHPRATSKQAELFS